MVEIIRTKMFVCGTGGFPILFTTQQEFNNYYYYINTNYVHIVRGIREQTGRLIIDYISVPDYENCFDPKFDTTCSTCKFKNFNTILFIDNELEKKIDIRNLLDTDVNDFKLLTHTSPPNLCLTKKQHRNLELHKFIEYKYILVPYFINIEAIYDKQSGVDGLELTSDLLKLSDPLESAAAGHLEKGFSIEPSSVAKPSSINPFELKYLKYKYKYLRLKMLKN